MSETKAQVKAREQEEARELLRGWFPVGSVVPVVLRHVTSSGMSRSISVLRGHADGDVSDVSWTVARALGDRLDDRHGGIKMGGVGMDMGFALVYNLARVLYAGGFPCTGVEYGADRCPSNDHSNERGEARNYTPGRLHSDPGYAFTHKWVN